MELTTLWDTCREINPWLAISAFFAVSIRLGFMAGDKARWTDAPGLHVMMWFAWVAFALLNSSLGSAYYADGTTPANYTSGTRLLLNIGALALAAWWPHRRRYAPTTQECTHAQP